MKTWSQAFRDGLVSGTIASVISTIVLSACGKKEDGTPYGPTNATSQWFWGERAAHQDNPSTKYTAVGYAIHHASSLLWAVIFEKWFGECVERKELGSACRNAAFVATLASVVDLKLTPVRLHPGFEKRLSSTSLFLVYASFGAGLLLRGLAVQERPARRISHVRT